MKDIIEEKLRKMETLLTQASAIANGLSIELDDFELTKPFNVLAKELTDSRTVVQYMQGMYDDKINHWAWKAPQSFTIAKPVRAFLKKEKR